MDGILRESLGAEQLQLLQVIYEPFDKNGEWPLWQYVDLILEADGLDAAAVLASLPRVGASGPMSMSYGLTWRADSHLEPQPDSVVVLTVAGLRYRPDASSLLAAFMVTIRYLIEQQRKLVPDPRKVVDATVRSDAIEKQILSADIDWTGDPLVDRTMSKVRMLIGHEPFLYNVVQQPQPEVEQWTVRVPAILRAYRDVDSVDAYLDQVIARVASDEPPSVPLSAGPLDIPDALGYLDAVWKGKTGSRLFVDLDPASVARLTLACDSEEEFNSLMSALADVLGQAVTPGKAVPPQGGALEAVRDYLIPKLDADAADRAVGAFRTLIRLRRIRVAAQHGDARHKAATAFREIGLQFPPAGWDQAWIHIAATAKRALDVLREEIHAGLPDS